MPDAADQVRLQVLHREECLRLLPTVPIGRIVFTEAGLPAVLPVNFTVHEGAVYLRTTPGSKLSAALRRAIVAFEADEFDARARTGWSVTVVGRAMVVEDPALIAEVERQVTPWPGGSDLHLVRIAVDVVSGRLLSPVAAITAY